MGPDKFTPEQRQALAAAIIQEIRRRHFILTHLPVQQIPMTDEQREKLLGPKP